MNQQSIRRAFEAFLKGRSLKLTQQRDRIFQRVFATHEHFSAERLYAWLRGFDGPAVSRATVYRTLGLLVEGGFLESIDPGSGERLYEHVLGHRHHDHLVCLVCGKLQEFSDPEIERLQVAAAARKGFVIAHHDLRIFGTCSGCARKGHAAPRAQPRPDGGRERGMGASRLDPPRPRRN